jgi:hypothetical protein
MTAAQLYAEIIRQNPTFEREGATLSAAGLRKLVFTCYCAGRVQGQRDAKKHPPGSMPPFMAELFRGFRQ